MTRNLRNAENSDSDSDEPPETQVSAGAGRRERTRVRDRADHCSPHEFPPGIVPEQCVDRLWFVDTGCALDFVQQDMLSLEQQEMVEAFFRACIFCILDG